MTALTASYLRSQIDLMEALDDVATAIEDVSDLPAEQCVNALFTDRAKQHLSFAHGLPREIALIGLRAMRKALEEKLFDLSRSVQLRNELRQCEGVR